MDLPTSDRIVHFLISHRPWVLGCVLLGGVGAALVAAKASFDYSVLALKDESSESMSTLRELQGEGLSTDYQLFYLAGDGLNPANIEALETVEEVRQPTDLVPEDQLEKLYVVEDLRFMLADVQSDNPTPEPVSMQENRLALKQLRDLLGTEESRSEHLDVILVDRFGAVLQELTEQPDEALSDWQSNVLDGLAAELEWLNRALAVEVVSFSDLPTSVTQRLVGPQGQQLVSILPSQDIADVDALSDFITQVRGELPSATGRPVIEWGVGQIVVGSFREALTFAVIAIGVVLLLSLRSLRSMLMIMLPLGLTALCTLAFGVLVEQPINMASILVLPLIFGLGVDNGIHVVDRYLGEGDVDHLMHSSTPRAVLLSTLTTIGAFSALSLSPHMGTASIGMLLAVSVGFLLIFTIFLLPVLLARSE